jgi:hypothetical protein
VTTEYGGAYGGRPWRHAAPPYRGQPPNRVRRGSRRWLAALAALVLGVAGLAVALVGVAFQVLPRHFTAQQQRQITDWEVGKRWRAMPAGAIFPGSLQYAAPMALSDDQALRLTASRVGIARQATCAAATDKAVGTVLTRQGCEAMLRATYVDGTDSYVITVGVAVLPGSAQVSAAERELAGVTRGNQAGVHTMPVAGSLAAAFTNPRRQLSGSMAAGPYLVFYTIGYTDDRPHVPVAADSYADAEMMAAGQGVAQVVTSVLNKPVPPPHCPGTPGC